MNDFKPGLVPGSGAMAPRPTKVEVDLSTCKDLECEKCKAIYFVPERRYKILPALLSPTKREESIPLDVLRCAECGERRYNSDIDGPKPNEKDTSK